MDEPVLKLHCDDSVHWLYPFMFVDSPSVCAQEGKLVQQWTAVCVCVSVTILFIGFTHSCLLIHLLYVLKRGN